MRTSEFVQELLSKRTCDLRGIRGYGMRGVRIFKEMRGINEKAVMAMHKTHGISETGILGICMETWNCSLVFYSTSVSLVHVGP